MFCQQNAGQISYLLSANKSFQNVQSAIIW